MKEIQDYTIFNYVPPIPNKKVKYQDKTIVTRTGVISAPNFIIPGNSKNKVGKEIPPYQFLMDNLETSFPATVDKSCRKTCGDILERFIKPIESTMFGQPVYSLHGPGPYISISGPHEEFFDGGFVICIGGKKSDVCCRPIRTHKLWSDL